MQNTFLMSEDERAAWGPVRDAARPLLAAHIGDQRDRDIFLLRLERYFADLYAPLRRLYAGHPGFAAMLEQLGPRLVAACAARSNRLKLRDLERELSPDWFQHPSMVGGIYYVDRFAGTLAGVREHLDYI